MWSGWTQDVSWPKLGGLSASGSCSQVDQSVCVFLVSFPQNNLREGGAVTQVLVCMGVHFFLSQLHCFLRGSTAFALGRDVQSRASSSSSSLAIVPSVSHTHQWNAAPLRPVCCNGWKQSASSLTAGVPTELASIFPSPEYLSLIQAPEHPRSETQKGVLTNFSF